MIQHNENLLLHQNQYFWFQEIPCSYIQNALLSLKSRKQTELKRIFPPIRKEHSYKHCKNLEKNENTVLSLLNNLRFYFIAFSQGWNITDNLDLKKKTLKMYSYSL